MFFGTRVDEQQSFRLLDAYVAAGGRWLDTANNYAAWLEGATGDESELLLHRWLTSRPVPEGLVIATKVGARPTPDGSGFDGRQGLSAPAVRTQVEGSLRRLGVERIDLLYAHIDDRTVPLAETLGAFGELVGQGLLGAVACSNYTRPRLAEALAASRAEHLVSYQVAQMRASYLTPAPDADFGIQVPLDDAFLGFATENAVLVAAYSALLSGAYSRPDRPLPPEYRHAGTERQLTAVRTAAEHTGSTPNQVVLAWLSAHGVVPVLGVSREDQLTEALTAPDLTPDTVAALDAARG
jgi:aryl-alcohol dehydrogenase-like predicted oxidoreductase